MTEETQQFIKKQIRRLISPKGVGNRPLKTI